MWMSVPQMDVFLILIMTSMGPISGSGTSSSQRPSSALDFTSAFILVVMCRNKKIEATYFVASIKGSDLGGIVNYFFVRSSNFLIRLFGSPRIISLPSLSMSM